MNRLAVLEDANAWSELDRHVLVADYSAGLYRRDCLRIDRDTLVYAYRDFRALVLKPDIDDLADLHSGELDLIALLQPGNVIEKCIERVPRARQHFDFAQRKRQNRECDDAQNRENPDDELRGSTCVHRSLFQPAKAVSFSSPEAFPAKKRLKTSSSAAITSATVPLRRVFPS